MYPAPRSASPAAARKPPKHTTRTAAAHRFYGGQSSDFGDMHLGQDARLASWALRAGAGRGRDAADAAPRRAPALRLAGLPVARAAAHLLAHLERNDEAAQTTALRAAGFCCPSISTAEDVTTYAKRRSRCRGRLGRQSAAWWHAVRSLRVHTPNFAV